MDEDATRNDSAGERRSRFDVPLLRRLITRRRFVGAAGATAAGVALQNELTWVGREAEDAIHPVVHALMARLGFSPSSTRTGTVRLLRREDMLRLSVDLYNLVPDSANANQYIKQNTRATAYVVVTFPSQHIAEEALLRTDGGQDEHYLTTDLARARLAGPTKLAFVVPEAALPLPRTAEGLLKWSTWVPNLVPNALPATSRSKGGALVQPAPGSARQIAQTAIELPWRLILSPLPAAGWIHSSVPATGDQDVHELWHSRLGERNTSGTGRPVIESPRLGNHVRAVWSTDPGRPPTNDAPNLDEIDDDDVNPAPNTTTGDGDADGRFFEPFRATLSPKNRIQIVQNSAGYTRPGGKVEPIDINRLMLTPLGGYLDAEGSWDDPTSLVLEFWRHRASLGRDTYVQAIESGFFMPWGFPAVRVKTTTRIVENRDFDGVPFNKINVAFLEQRIHYIIKRPSVTFPLQGQPNSARDLPFRSIKARTTVTPDVNEDATTFPGIGYIPMLGDDPFRFALEATDWEGRVIHFRAPMVWVDASIGAAVPSGSGYVDKAADARKRFNDLGVTHPLRRIGLGGQRVAFARAATSGDTTLETQDVTLSVTRPTGTLRKGQTMFAPTMNGAHARLEAAEVVSGSSLGAQSVRYPSFFRDRGFTDDKNDKNKADVFLVMDVWPVVSFGQTDRSGGVTSPSMPLRFVSRSKGAIGGTVGDVQAGTFTPTGVFDLSATLLGGLKMSDVIRTATLDQGGLDRMVQLQSSEIPGGRVARLHWTPTLQPDPLGILRTDRGEGRPGSFTLDATTTALETGVTTSDVRGDLRDVTLQLLGVEPHFIDVEVRRIVFTSRTGTSPHVDVALGEIRFAGPLTFINSLREVLANQDGPIGVEVDGSGIVARSTLSLPSIGVGIFQLSHLAFTAKLGVPFDNRPVYAEFGISSRNDPFLVAVSIFGGGGWFALRVDSTGIQEVDAGFEFGATVSLDFGVAGGSIEVMAGVYFSLEKLPSKKNKITLSGFVRLHGEVHVAFVSVGLLCELDLSYVNKGGQSMVTGRAICTLEIPLAPDISFEIERSFGGNPHDPRFVDQIHETEWQDYVAAFAAEGGRG